MKVCSLPSAGTVAAAVLGLVALRSPAGGLQPQGAEYQLTRGVPGDQVRPRLTLGASGGWMLWQDAAMDGDGLGIAAVRLAEGGGAVQGVAFCVNQGVAGDQENPAVTSLQDGGAFVAWQGGRQGFQRVYARVLRASGGTVGDDIPLASNGGDHQIDPAVTTLADGSVLAVWSTYRQDGGYGYDIYGRRFSAQGEPLSDEFRLNSSTGMNRRSPTVTALPGGGFLSVWVAERQLATRNNLGTPGRIVTGSGVPVFEVNLVARPFHADGTPAGSEQRVSDPASVAAHPALATLPNGQAILAWTRKDGADTSRRLDIASRLLEASGVPVGTEQVVNTTQFGDQYAPSLAVNRHGVLAIWTSMGQDGSWEGVFGRWLDAGGVPSGDEMPINGQFGGGQILPAVATAPDSGLVVAWSSNLPRVGYEIFAQRLAPLLLRVESTGVGRMRLTWPTVAGGVYQLQMSRDGRVWTHVGGTQTAQSDTDSSEISVAGQVVLYRVLRAR